MNKLVLGRVYLIGLVAFFLVSFQVSAQRSLYKWVDPFIGTDNNGNVLPGTSLPFSFMRLGPDVPLPHPTSGYLPNKPIKGFSHTHVSGTGGNGQYGNISTLPETGPLLLNNNESDKAEESASVGYYKVKLLRYNVLVELTQTEKVGLHRYTFPASNQSHILLDISSMIKKNQSNRYMHNLQTVASIHDSVVEGFGEYVGGWGNNKPNKIFFYAEIDKKVDKTGTWNQDSIFNGYGKDSLIGKDGGIVFTFSTGKSEKVLLKVGISSLSIEAAKNNIQNEMPDWNFEKVKKEAERKWDNYLNRIKINGATEKQKRIFYTALYHAFVMPSDITGQNPEWQSDESAFWDFYTLWDTFRTLNPLFTLIAPEQERNIIRSLLDIYKHRGWLPDAWIVGDYGGKQGGTNADVVIADAIVKDLGGFDYQYAYKAIRKNADSISIHPGLYGRHREYLQNGFCTSSINCGTSYTLEYAYNDFCVGRVADYLGYKNEAEKYKQRSLLCYNLFNSEKGFFWSKNNDGIWAEGFAPDYQRKHQQSGYFYEGTPYQYTFYVPHDIAGLIKRVGGKEKFLKFLDNFFDGKYYRDDNQPDIQVPFLYNYINRIDKTAERVHYILNRSFDDTPSGLPGNDDAGCMSAWYVFASMGIYPVPGQDIYLLSVPAFKKTEVALENNKKLTIIANNLSTKNKYIQSARLNGKKLEDVWITHKDIANGATLVFEMGAKNIGWGERSAPPPSITTNK